MVGEKLALIGSINDEILHADELAVTLLGYLKRKYPLLLAERYPVAEIEDPYRMLEEAALARKCLGKGGDPDVMRAAGMIMEEFRSGKIGRITLEDPEEWK